MNESSEIKKPFQKHPNNMRVEQLNDGDIIMREKITAKEQLIYACIKYCDGEKGCYPSLATLQKISGASIPTIRKCINILENEGFIQTYKKGKYQYYRFLKEDVNFMQVPKEFIGKSDWDLSFTEKAYLISINQYLYRDDKGFGVTTLTDDQLSKISGLESSTVSKLNKKLQRKNYLQINNILNEKTGTIQKYKSFSLKDLCLALCNKVKELDDRVEKIEENNTVRDNAYKSSILELARLLADTHGEEVYENIKENLDKIIDDRNNVIKL